MGRCRSISATPTASSHSCTCPATGSSAPQPPDITGSIIRRERLIVATALALIVALCWWFLISGAGVDHGGGMADMAPPSLLALIAMWWLMMLAMMLPSAAPTILLYERVAQQRQNQAVAQTWVFALGYALLWLGFAIVAALIQQSVAAPDMALPNADIASAVLIAAGGYQLSPLKNACLRQCRTPAQFLSRHWRAGMLGAIRLGMLHGAFCVGCCWLLMALLFVGGVMNLAWIAVLTIAVAAEKLVRRGAWVARIAGLALILWAGWRLIA